MNNEIPHKQIIDAALSQIGSVADVNTVIGQPMTLAEGVTVIPFSKVSVGFASGGADFDGKNKKEGDAPHFAGGNGAGVSVTPLGFLVLEGGQVRSARPETPGGIYGASPGSGQQDDRRA